MTHDLTTLLSIPLPPRVADSFPVNMEDGVSLRVTEVAVSDGKFALTYSVRNGTPSLVYLASQLFHRERDGFRVDPNLAYSIAITSSALLLAKQMIEVPPDMQVEAPEVPYVLRLDPGADHSERMVRPLPMEPRSPYDRRPRPPTARRFTEIVFSLGYALAETPIEVQEVHGLDGRALRRIDYTTLRRNQRLKALGPFAADLEAFIDPPEPAR